jgi:hypothetical protein
MNFSYVKVDGGTVGRREITRSSANCFANERFGVQGARQLTKHFRRSELMAVTLSISHCTP